MRTKGPSLCVCVLGEEREGKEMERMRWKAVLAMVLAVLLAMALGCAGATEAEEVVLDVTQFGADGTDTLDDRGAIQQALDVAVQYEGTEITVKVPKGEYYLDGPLGIFSDTRLECEDGVVFHRMHEGDLMLLNYSKEGTGANPGGYGRSSNITIIGGVWDGHATGSQAMDLFYIYHASDIHISGVTMQHVSGDHFIEFAAVKNGSVKNSTFRDYIALSGTTEEQAETSEAVQLDHAKKDSSAHSEPYDGTVCQGITVSGCTFTNCVSGVGDHHTESVGANYNFSNNTFKDLSATCINLWGVDGATASGNTATNVGRLVHVEVTKGSITISDNTVSGTKNLLFAQNVSGSLTVTGNSAEGSRERIGLEVQKAEGVTLSQNTLDGFTSGISLITCSGCSVTGNTVKNVDKNGIYIRAFSGAVTGNSFTLCDEYNIYTKGTCTGTLEDNIYDLPYGIYNDAEMAIGANHLVVDGEEIPEATGYTIYYHRTEEEAASEKTTFVEGGGQTTYLTRNELGFFLEGKVFAGWKAWRNDTKTWRVKDKDGERQWAAELPEGGKYMIFPDGGKLEASNAVAIGAELHFYGQWEDTSTFKVMYYLTEGGKPSKTVTEVTYGTETPTEIYQDLGFFVEGEKFLGWKAWRTDTKSWRVKDAAGNISWAAEVPEGGSYALYESGATVSEDVPGGVELHLIAEQEKTDSFVVYYHRDDDAEADERTTTIKYGKSTPILTQTELGYILGGKKFLGWKVFRTDRLTWRVKDSKGKEAWKKELPAGGSWSLLKNGASINNLTKAGGELHLYGQWEETTTFTVYYHQNDKAKEVKTTTEITYGKKTKTLEFQALNFATNGKRFTGWKVWRADTREWRVQDKKGKESWAAKPPKGGSYALWDNGIKLSKEVPAGTEVHFYGQWKTDKTFTVYYHKTDKAKAAKEVTIVKYGKKTPILSYKELGFKNGKKKFLGWKSYRTDRNLWRVKDKKGNETWAKKPPAGGSYVLYKDMAPLMKQVYAGYDLHLYAQWGNK